MGAYNNIDPAIAGLLDGLDHDTISRCTKETAGIAYGLPVFMYAGNDVGAYAYHNNRSYVIFDADFVTGNSIDVTVDGEAVTTVPWNSTHDDTMTDLKNQIETDITGATVTLVGTGGNNRDFYITIEDDGDRVVTAVVTGGASQAVATITYDSTMVFKGMSVFTQQESAVKTDLEDNVIDAADAKYSLTDPINILVHGGIHGITADAVQSQTQAYCVASGGDQGKLTDDPTDNVILDGVFFEQDVSAAGIAKVRVNK